MARGVRRRGPMPVGSSRCSRTPSIRLRRGSRRARLVGARAPLVERAAAFVDGARGLLDAGTLLCIDYGVPRRPSWRCGRGASGCARTGRTSAAATTSPSPGDQDITVDIPFDQLPEPDSVAVTGAVPAAMGHRRTRGRRRAGVDRAGRPARPRGDAHAQPGRRVRGPPRSHRPRRLPRRRMALHPHSDERDAPDTGLSLIARESSAGGGREGRDLPSAAWLRNRPAGRRTTRSMR